MKRATYIGDRDDLAGKPAIIRPGVAGGVHAKFIGRALTDDLPHGWAPFSAEEFMLKTEEVRHEK